MKPSKWTFGALAALGIGAGVAWTMAMPWPASATPEASAQAAAKKPAVGASKAKASGSARGKGAAADPAVPLLVDVAWLAAHLRDPQLVLLHVGDATKFAEAHLPGARLVTMADLSVSAPMGQGLVLELPPAEELRKQLEKLGISDDSRVVAYFGEDWVSPTTRVIFTLDAAGLGGRAGMLDGGMPAWRRAGKAVADEKTAPPPTKPGKLSPLHMQPRVVEASGVFASLGKPQVALIDARDRAYYDGTKTGGMLGHTHRAGHILGARSIPYGSVVDDKSQLRSDDELRALFAAAGVAPGDALITYCHIGQQATAVIFAARKLGYAVQLYDGAFEDWSLFHPGFPVETTP